MAGRVCTSVGHDYPPFDLVSLAPKVTELGRSLCYMEPHILTFSRVQNRVFDPVLRFAEEVLYGRFAPLGTVAILLLTSCL